MPFSLKITTGDSDYFYVKNADAGLKMAAEIFTVIPEIGLEASSAYSSSAASSSISDNELFNNLEEVAISLEEKWPKIAAQAGKITPPIGLNLSRIQVTDALIAMLLQSKINLTTLILSDRQYLKLERATLNLLIGQQIDILKVKRLEELPRDIVGKQIADFFPGLGSISRSLRADVKSSSKKVVANVEGPAELEYFFKKRANLLTTLDPEREPLGAVYNHLSYNGGVASFQKNFTRLEALLTEYYDGSLAVTLNLPYYQLGVERAVGFIESIKQYKLIGFNFSANEIGDAGAIALAAVLKENETLTSLKISMNKIGDAGAIALAAALKENKKLTSLDLSANQIGIEGVKALAEALKKNKTLTNLNIYFSRIGDAGAADIVEALKANQTLTSLGIANSNIGIEGVIALAAALKKNQTLTSLDISLNDIGDAGAKAVAELLITNKTLTSLNLSYNEIGIAGAEIAEALKKNKTLTSLNIVGNEIGDAGAIALAAALKENQTLTSLDISYSSGIGDAGAAGIAEALKKNKTLTSLNIVGNEIGDSGAIAIAASLKENHTLTSLAIGNRNIRSKGIDALLEAIKNPSCNITRISIASEHSKTQMLFNDAIAERIAAQNMQKEEEVKSSSAASSVMFPSATSLAAAASVAIGGKS